MPSSQSDGTRSSSIHRPKNRLLAGLPEEEFTRLRPLLKSVSLTVKQVLHPTNQPIREVFFLNGGVASLTTTMKDGAMVEVATVGDEGFAASTPISEARWSAAKRCSKCQTPAPR